MAGDAISIRIEDLIAAGTLTINDGYRAKNSELSTSGLPFARAQNINSGFRFDNVDRFPEENIARVGAKISQEGDVVFTSKGTVGRFAIVRSDTPRFVYSPQLCFWRSANRDRIDPRWLFYWMQSREFFVQYAGVAGQTDMAEYVSLRDQRMMNITLPPIEEQRAIAHILGTLDDKIELNRRMSETLEETARAIFKSWFVDFNPVRAKAEGRDPGLPKHIADLFPDRFEDSELGELPSGWEVGTLGKVAENPRRTIKPAHMEEATPYIGLEHMPRQSISLADWDSAEGLESNKYKFKRGEILFGKLRPYFHKVGIAPVDGICSTDILVVAAKQPEWFGFVLEHVSSGNFVNHTTATSSGTKMPRTNWKDMSSFSIVIPPPSLAKSFGVFVQSFLERIVENIHEARTLAAIRNALLPKLISGELRVPEDERMADEALRDPAAL